MENKHIYNLVICLDKKGKKSILLSQGTIDEIDNLTMSFNNSQELRSYFSEQEELFEEKYKKDIEYIKTKYNKKESGDITIIDPEKINNTEIPRESIVYNKNVEIFEIAIDDQSFVQFLKKADYSKYCAIQRYNNAIGDRYKKITDERISWLIREVPKIYEEYSTKYNKLPLKTIYKHYLKEQQILKKYQEMYDTLEQKEEPDKLEAYEIEFLNEQNYNQKYELKEKKGKQKIKTNSWEK